MPLSPALFGVLALALAGCAAPPHEDSASRAANEAALAAGLPGGASVVVIEDGEARAADSLDEVFGTPGAAASRFVFRPDEAGERTFTVAYLPRGGVVAGDAFVDALGAELRTGARGDLTLVRGMRSVAAARDRTVAVTLTPPDGSGALPQTVRVTLDPQARGALLLPRTLAHQLRAPAFAIPGVANVVVVLGRPFAAHRARLRAEIAELGADALVEVLYEAPPPDATR